VDRLLRDLGAPSGSALERLLEVWPEVVGPVLATSTRPLAVRDRRLVVEADDPAVASTVRWSKAALVASLNRLVEPGVVTEIDVRVGHRGGSGRSTGGAEGRL
jgi:predicted nucleic acid-binding Zn ribbon protein